MLGWLKAASVPAVAAAMLAGATVAQADTVSYYTSGAFSTTNPGAGSTHEQVSNSATVSTLTSAGSNPITLSFFSSQVTYPVTSLGQPGDITSDPLPATIYLGTVQLTGQAGTTGSFDSFAGGDGFVLTLTQTNPAAPAGFSTATVTGNVTFTHTTGSHGFDSGYATLTFAPTVIPIFAGGQEYDYKLDPNPITVTIVGGSSAPAGGYVTLDADVSMAPLPATASMGFGLLGCLGGFGLLRRRRQLA